MKKLWLPLLLGGLLTAVLFSIGVVLSKGGGETFSILLFPFTSNETVFPVNHPCGRLYR